MNNLAINYYGTWTLFKKEIWRFIKVYHQTLFSPLVNALLLLAIFSLAVGRRFETINDVPFQEFMAAGLIMMVAMQNAFANSSSSFVMGKVLGHIIDYLIPPLSAFEHFFYALFCLFFASMFLAILGMLCGILSESFDHMSAITSYLITPLTFLSGTFYSVENLPLFWQNFAHFNPFFYMIDGFRYGLTGHHDGDIATGAIVIIAVNIIFGIVTYLLLKKGYKIKS